jgi:hypothetical protein
VIEDVQLPAAGIMHTMCSLHCLYSCGISKQGGSHVTDDITWYYSK